jgi:2,4-dienoyl-CoA reductase-like NADH-dependent reductase (Old Yellow Enzyme family)
MDNALPATSELFTPFSINGKLTVKNRLVMPPIYTMWNFDSQEFKSHHIRRAQGGVGMSVVPVPTWSGLGIERDPWFEEHSQYLIEQHHRHGCKILPQVFTGEGEHIDSMSAQELEVLPEQLGRIANYLKGIGYDGVEIHGAHHTVFMHLLSPALNKRNDKYGGSLENRMRIQLETIRAIRKAVGLDFPVLLRFSASDLIEGGADLETTVPYAQKLEESGLDCLDISCGGTTRSPPYSMSPGERAPAGTFAHYSQAIKRAVTIPVIVAGKINTFTVAADIVKNGQADLVAIGRPLVADPDLPNKWQTARFEAVVRCCSTNRGCQDNSIAKGKPLQCIMNKNLGKEHLELSM